MDLLNVIGLHKQNGDGFVLQDINLTQRYLQNVAIAGASGAGKSTLLKMIAGLVQPDSGEILLDGKKIKGPDEKLVPGYADIAFLSQHFELRNNYTVEELLSYASKLTDSSAADLYTICRIHHLLKHKTNELSGGEKQRIALARLLSTSPRLLLLDEPFSNLDRIHKNILKSVLTDIGNELAITCMLVSHDPRDVLSWADEILILQNGQFIQRGTPEEVYFSPVNQYAAELFGHCNIIIDSGIKTQLGIPPGLLNGEEVFVRPEFIEIVGNNSSSFRGIVHSARFAGSYYEVDVLGVNSHISFITADKPPQQGDTVYLSLKENMVNRLHSSS